MLDNAVWPRPRFGLRPWHARSVSALLGVAAIVYLALYAAALAVPELHRFLGGLAYHIPPLVALGSTPRVLRRTRGLERVGWMSILLLLLSWDAAEWVYSYYSIVLDSEAPIPSLADWFYYAGYVAFISGLPLFARSGRGLHDPRSVVDAAIVVVVTGTLFWRFVVEPQLPPSGAGTGDYVLVGYPLLDLGLLAALVVTFYGRRNYPSHVRWLLVSVAVLVVTDLAYIEAGDETVAQASVLDLGWLAGYWFIAFALNARANQPTALRLLPAGRQSTLSLILPYAALIPLIAAMVVTGSFGGQATEVTAGAVLAATLVMLRQWLTLFENQRLYSSLEAEASELERLRERAAYQAEHDELTGLLNRRAWFAAAQAQGRGSIALFDIDNFKDVNDRFGHPAGDVILQDVTRRLRDLLPREIPLGRIGGEEFAAAFADSEASAVVRCRDVLAEISACPVVHAEGSLTVTLSAGVTAWVWSGDRERSLEVTYELADRALYEAKRGGRNRVTTPARRAA